MSWSRTVGSLALASMLCALPARADVARDGSIGAAPAGVVPSGVDPEGVFADYLIAPELGEQSGANLFHSFERFAIGATEVASFSGPDPLGGPQSVERIVGRVTGADPTLILGRLRSTIDGAALFLLSPSGMIVGDGAVLEIPGSFYISTADVLRFEGGLDFDAASSLPPTLLASAPPSAFGFTTEEPAPISFNGSTEDVYGVPPGETFSVVGGHLTVTGFPEGTVASNTISSPGSQVQLASAAAPVEIPLDLRDLDPTVLAPGSLGEVEITQNAFIDVSGSTEVPSGRIVIRGERFVLNGDSTLQATHRLDGADSTGAIDVSVRSDAELGAALLTAGALSDGKGSGISVAGDAVTLRGTRVTIGSVRSGAGGDLSLSGRTLTIEGGSVIRSISRSSGRGSDVRLAATGVDAEGRSLVIRGASSVSSGTSDLGPGGAIEIEAAGRVEVSDGSQIISLNEGSSLGGAVAITAEEVAVSGTSQIASRAEGAGAGGVVELGRADRPLAILELKDSAQVLAETSGPAAGGALAVHAEEMLIHNTEPGNDTFLFTSTRSAAADAGPGGSLALHVEDLELAAGGQAFAVTEGAGPGGDLSVLGADTVRVHGRIEGISGDILPSSLAARVAEEAEGTGGALFIEARVVEVSNDGEITSRTQGPGDAAPEGVTALEIANSERVTVRGGEDGAALISATSVSGPDVEGGGDGGDLVIETGLLELLDGGLVTASTTGSGSFDDVGDAGDVTIIATDVVISGLDPAGVNNSGIFARSNSDPGSGSGAGGDITITADRLAVADEGQISVSTRSGASAGTIALHIGEEIEIASGSRVTALGEFGVSGSTGSVIIDGAQRLTVSGAEISARAEGLQEIGGSVAIHGVELVALTGDARVTAENTGIGAAGDVEITGVGSLQLDSGSEITTFAAGSDGSAVSGGNVTIEAREIVELLDSRITADVEQGVGQGGNVSIDPVFVVLNGSAITARAAEGRGGVIDIDTQHFFRSAESVVDASGGTPGVVTISSPELDLSGELTTLPASFLDASALLASACAARTAREGSFVVQRHAAIVPPPDAPLSAPGMQVPAVAAAGAAEACAP
jgi:filamentous hemagglutinin family protein